MVGIATHIHTRGTISASTLAAQAAISAASPPPLEQEFQQESTLLLGGYRGLTVGEGPIYWGIHAADLSAAEIAGVIALGGPDNSMEEENLTVKRKVRLLGTLKGEAVAGPLLGSRGQAGFIWYKHSAMWNDAISMNVFIFNDDDSALTTGLKVQFFRRVKGRWL